MSIEGWYYLHENGDLIYKRELGETAADIRESSFAKGLWPLDPACRGHAWKIIIEGLAAGAKADRVRELVNKWQCDTEDAQRYAKHIGVLLSMDGNKWCATKNDFINLQEDEAGFGDECYEAMADLAQDLGYQPSKMWGASFRDLVSR